MQRLFHSSSKHNLSHPIMVRRDFVDSANNRTSLIGKRLPQNKLAYSSSHRLFVSYSVQILLGDSSTILWLLFTAAIPAVTTFTHNQPIILQHKVYIRPLSLFYLHLTLDLGRWRDRRDAFAEIAAMELPKLPNPSFFAEDRKLCRLSGDLNISGKSF